jgi:probable phosphoglycerate mutase
MLEIVLVRHAQPEWEPGGIAVDHPGLTALGRAQAQRVAQALAKESFDELYVSPLRRARETAEPIAAALSLSARVESWLEELRLPTLEGKTAEQVQEFFRRARARDLESWWEGAAPGGESFRHFYERVAGGVETLLTGAHGTQVHLDSSHRLWRVQAEPRRLLIVAHEGTIAVILSHLLGLEPIPWAFVRFSSAWAAISRVHTVPVSSGAVWVLGAFNRAEHLAGLEGPEIPVNPPS